MLPKAFKGACIWLGGAAQDACILCHNPGSVPDSTCLLIQTLGGAAACLLTHVSELNHVPSFQLGPGLDPAVGGLWGDERRVGALFICL